MIEVMIWLIAGSTLLWTALDIVAFLVERKSRRNRKNPFDKMP